MKKNLLFILLAITSNIAVAQNLSKNGHQITPEPGEWGLGIDVNPFFEYFGNMFNGTSDNSAPGWNYTTDQPIPMTITGLMIKDATTAYRARVRIGTGSQTQVSVIDRDGSTANPPATVEDERKSSSTNIIIGAGLQKTRGKHRLHGIYGAEILIGSGNGGKTEYDYGNPFNLDSTTIGNPVGAPYGQTTITDWSSGAGNQMTASSRTTESKSGNTFYLGLRGFIGIEYFFAPKISIAGEFGWGLGLASTGEGEEKTESFDQGTDLVNAFDDSVRSNTSKTGKSSTFGLDNDSGNPFSPGSGSLRMTFYF